MDQHGLVSHVDPREALFRDCCVLTLFTADHDAVQICDRIQIEVGQVLSARVAMKRTVEICPRVGDHLDLADMKLSSGRVTSFGIFATEIVADHGSGKTFVGNHSVLDTV